AVHAFCLSRDQFKVFPRICSKTELKRTFSLLQFHLAKIAADIHAARARGSMALANFQSHLKTLNEMLIRPIEPFISEMNSLVFVPVDFLHYLPFHALFDGATYLTDRFTISYAPTATIYRLFIERPTKHNAEALLVGVPDENAPLIAEEIESIRSVLPE